MGRGHPAEDLGFREFSSRPCQAGAGGRGVESSADQWPQALHKNGDGVRLFPGGAGGRAGPAVEWWHPNAGSERSKARFATFSVSLESCS